MSDNVEHIESCSSSSTSSSNASTTSWDEHPHDEETWTEQQQEDENSPEKERQLLLLMLLAQVCALHDPSPKTFTVHVLELFERGILDRESIRFLFELGLVPSHSSSTSNRLLLSNQDVTAALAAVEAENAMQLENALQLIPPPTRQESMEQVRAQEASAIRLHLEQSHENVNETSSSSPRHSSWAVEHHPLSLSRFQREFNQVRLLNAGAFGQVFHVISKLDGTDYAVKRVAFGVHGFHSEKITQAVREVTCLAQCHHPHCVRYYTSWLEPSWMTGSNVGEQQPLLLTHGSTSSNFESSRRASFSFGANHDVHEFEEWTRSKDDSFLESPPKQTASSPISNYRYEICLFIQMQLCTSSTLADWIVTRNANAPSIKSRAGPAIQIFTQLLDGLAHVHEQNIVHRDLKPANVFVSQDGRFLIGDFGLSRLLRNANGGRDFCDSAVAAEPLTVGIGTASYAAPEQLRSRDYGTAADMFGLGLILLELFCIFETEHERIDNFRQCRSQSVPEWLSNEYPFVAEIILKCTRENPSERPTAADLCSQVLTEQDILRLQLEEKDKELKKQRSEIDEKDKIIEELKSQVNRMSMERNGSAKVEINDDSGTARQASFEGNY